MSELPRPGACFAGVAVMWLASFVCFSSVALADPYTPPEPPTEPALEVPACGPEVEPYEGEDSVAGELRRLRSELRGVCGVSRAQRELLRERLWWLVAEAVTARQQRVVTNERLGELVDALDGKPPLAVADAQGVAVEAQYSDEIGSAIDASGAATKEAVWFLAGLAVALFAGYGLYRQVMPRG